MISNPDVQQAEVTRKPIVGGRSPGRNEPCPCGSDLKYKHCHGDAAKEQMIRAASYKFYQTMWGHAIHREQMKRGVVPYPFKCQSCGKGCEKPEQSTVSPGTLLCPKCGGVVDRASEETNDGSKEKSAGKS
jgi:hypothetical protein